jgi:hypothetical protein
VIADRIRPQCVMAPLGDGDEQNAGSDELGDNVVDGGMATRRRGNGYASTGEWLRVDGGMATRRRG